MLNQQDINARIFSKCAELVQGRFSSYSRYGKTRCFVGETEKFFVLVTSKFILAFVDKETMEKYDVSEMLSDKRRKSPMAVEKFFSDYSTCKKILYKYRKI